MHAFAACASYLGMTSSRDFSSGCFITCAWSMNVIQDLLSASEVWQCLFDNNHRKESKTIGSKLAWREDKAASLPSSWGW
jgi:hypothetical protein